MPPIYGVMRQQTAPTTGFCILMSVREGVRVFLTSDEAAKSAKDWESADKTLQYDGFKADYKVVIIGVDNGKAC